MNAFLLQASAPLSMVAVEGTSRYLKAQRAGSNGEDAPDACCNVVGRREEYGREDGLITGRRTMPAKVLLHFKGGR
jgi:hypothetical protein